MFARGKMCPMANVKSDRSMFCYNKGESTLYTTQKILNTSGMEKKSTNQLAFMGIKYSYSDKIH